MREADRLQEAREGTHVAGPPLRAYFLIQVERGVRAQYVVRVARRDDEWQEPAGERRLEVEVVWLRRCSSILSRKTES